MARTYLSQPRDALGRIAATANLVGAKLPFAVRESNTDKPRRPSSLPPVLTSSPRLPVRSLYAIQILLAMT
ncbi:uncharacterized protein AKAW2_21054S [Aspergillus luchuensis]|uniref:Uncharacterized protein n=1 Tax=Aspergillus kawachii TaxID=1069201 RepID=A0A7R7WT32_ASPKA|nr:uncharacterized protein AKAW2_21054S [Aspergillus luchuensis]BCR96114.1 hypothetical protein AKAW2_21054S [Aspergillus luchuensis]BCS08631.1 hypothetical protein ALUC_21001S [Aspergillus luchuensis]